MTQILNALPSEYINRIFCHYANSSTQIQIIRISNISRWYFERVIFPGQRLMFEALPEAQLEIYISVTSQAVLADRVSCDRLQIQHLNVPNSTPALP